MVTVPPVATDPGRYPTPEEYATMFERFSVPPSNRKVPGRRKKIGTLDWSEGSAKYFAGYDKNGQKILLDKSQLKALRVGVSRQKQSLRYRILMRLLSHYEGQEHLF